MDSRNLRFASLVVVAFLMAPISVGAWFGHGEKTIDLEYGGGRVEVQLVPDKGRVLTLKQVSPHRWVFDGSTADLVGGSYSIVLRNKGSDRLKVVVGVDGLNVYRKKQIVGRADADTGSILSPWETRTLKGWQMDQSTAQRFVFSPPEWSEGQGRTDSKICLIVVQVYRERHREWFGLSDVAEGETPEGKRKERSSRAAAPSPQIGTTSGDDVNSRVRTVSFESLTTYPEVWAEIDYGRHGGLVDFLRPGKLGVRIETDELGSRIVGVSPGSLAAVAGLKSGDIIVRIDTRDHPNPGVVSDIVKAKNPGEYVFVQVNRGRHEIGLKIRF